MPRVTGGQRGTSGRRARRRGVRCGLRRPQTRAGVTRVDRRTSPAIPAHPLVRRHRGRRPRRRPRCRSSTASWPRLPTLSAGRWAPSSSQDPDRPGPPARRASIGMDERSTARLAAEVADPAHPFTCRRRRPASPTFDREATTADGADLRRRLPAADRLERRRRRRRSGRSASAGRRRASSTTPSARR